MSGIEFLIDSNILIYHLNGEEKATRFLKENFDKSAISIITYLEVMNFDFPTQEVADSVEALLKRFLILNVDIKIAQKAIENRRRKKIKLPDNIILATAQIYHLKLVTRNLGDFFDIEVVNPYV
ncbi:MAG: nucleotide-binding protein [Epsilonproteobacteria bacterium]|nr:nucleotide-binding protein [Campylobacterota bacterium]NPA65194.1 type II toxin-antitoxin system VapC family toxin [Campylobacterota bacterium]